MNEFFTRIRLREWHGLAWLLAFSLLACGDRGSRLEVNPPVNQPGLLSIDLKGNMGISLLGKNEVTPIETSIRSEIIFDSVRNGTVPFNLRYRNYSMPEQERQLFGRDGKRKDSNQNDVDLSKLMEALVFRGSITRQGKCELTPHDSLAKRFEDAMEGDSDMPDPMRAKFAATLQEMFGEKMLSGFLNQYFHVLPDRAVNVGDSWQNETNAMNFVSMKMENQFRLMSLDDSVAVIAVRSTIGPGRDAQVMPMLGMAAPGTNSDKKAEGLFEMLGMALKMEFNGKQDGTIRVDRKTGLMRSSDMRQQFEGHIEAGPLKIPLRFQMRADASLSFGGG